VCSSDLSYWLLNIERSSDDPAGVTVSADVVWLCSGSAKFRKLSQFTDGGDTAAKAFPDEIKNWGSNGPLLASANVIAVLRRAGPFL
jgi:hypothetical protein